MTRDEPDLVRHKYYVNVARIILGLEHDPTVYPGAPSGIDPNHEHPPLAKLFIALSMYLIGDNAYGIRIPSAIFGVASLLIFYFLVKRLSKKSSIALLSSAILSLDNLFFVHGRIATLDIFVLGFMLLGFYWYFGNRPVMSGGAMAFATLCKIGGFYGFAVIAAYHILRGFQSRKRDWRAAFDWIERYTLAYGIIFIAALAVLDHFWGGYNNPFEHLSFIFSYTRNLSRETLQGIESYPWQWLINEVKIPYLTVNVNEMVEGRVTRTYASVAFQGAMNPLVIYLAIPSMLYMGYKALAEKDSPALFALTWFAVTYLPFLPMWFLWHRISYLFYFLNTVPAVALGIAYLLIDQRPPRIVIVLYLVALAYGFYSLFPFKVPP